MGSMNYIILLWIVSAITSTLQQNQEDYAYSYFSDDIKSKAEYTLEDYKTEMSPLELKRTCNLYNKDFQPKRVDEMRAYRKKQSDCWRQFFNKERSDSYTKTILEESNRFLPNKLEILKVKATPRTDRVYYRQKVLGLPVIGGYLTTHIRNDNIETNNVIKPVSLDFIPIPTVSAGDAAIVALRQVCKWNTACAWKVFGTPELSILPLKGKDDGDSLLVYNVIIANGLFKKGYYIDAKDSSVVRQFDLTKAATGNTVYDGSQSFETTTYSSNYYLEDLTRKFSVLDCVNGDCTTNYYISKPTTTWTATQDEIPVGVAYGTMKAFDYFNTTHGRNNIDGSGGPSVGLSINGVDNVFVSLIHYQTNHSNSYYTASGIIHGDGDGVNFGPMISIDGIGHEWTHGVIEDEVTPNGFDYQDESGALEEAIADIFGAMIERYARGESNNTWKHGEDYYTPAVANDCHRHLAYPHQSPNVTVVSLPYAGLPSHYSERYNGTADNGGVHINSGIITKAFYLLAKGGSHENGGVPMTGLNPDQAAQIWYYALVTYMTAGDDFLDARTNVLKAARDIFGQTSFQYLSVGTSFGLCGIGSVPIPTPTSLITNGGFEAGTELPWDFVGPTAVFFIKTGGTPRTGRGYAMLGVNNNAQGYISQSLGNIVPASVATNFSFWLWTTTSETGPSQNDLLYVDLLNNSTGGILSTLAIFSNLDATAGYVQKGPYSLNAYVGQQIKIQFRVNTNNNLPTTFKIDDVAVGMTIY